MNDVTTHEGEIQSGPLAVIDPGSALVRAEIDMQIATARRYPRLPDRQLQVRIADRATIDEETAEECLYTLIRGKKKETRGNRRPEPNAAEDRENKPIEGPSIRLAEIAAQVYGNCRIDARVIQTNHAEGYVEAEGVFHDLETNMASRATIRRSIKGRFGLFSQDMIVVTGNAACAIAKRNAILAGIPRSLYRLAYQEARAMVSGTAEKLVENRAKALKSFAPFGVKPEQILEKLDLQDEAEIELHHIATLRGMFATLKNGESTVEEMFAKADAGSFEKVSNPLSDDDGPGKGASDPLVVARERGAKAAAARMLRKAVPAEYAEEGRAAERDAWLEAFDAAKAKTEGQAGA